MTENKLNVNANTKEYIDEYIFIENGELNIGSAAKILSATATSAITGVETLSNEIRVSISTIFKVIFVNDEGNIVCMDEKADNTRSIVVNGVSADTAAVLCAKVVDCELSGTNLLNLRATVAINGWFEKRNVLDILSSEQPDIFVRTQKFDVESVELLAPASACFNFNNEARVPINRLIDTCVRVNVNNVFCGEGTARIEGEVNIDAVFVSENGLLMCQNFSNMFSTEIMAENVNSDISLTAEVCVESTEFKLNENDSRAIIGEVCLKIYLSYSDCRTVEGVVDAYSLENSLKLSYQEIDLDKEYCLSAARDKISSNIKIEGGLSNVECIVNAHLDGSSIVKNNDGLFVEGLLTGTVIYTDENGEFTSFKVEIPYSALVTKKFDCAENLKLNAQLNSVYARVRTASEIEISGEALFEITGKQSASVKIVGEITVGDKKETDDVAITLYIVKPGQLLFDVAKELNTTAEVLLEQNPEMEIPVKDGDKVLLYKKI